MKTFSLRIPLFLCALALGTAHIASAHTLERDGEIQGVMHITPSHEPTAGEPSHFEFFMSHPTGTFDPQAYTYTLTITGEGIATATPAVTAHGTTLSADYTFAREGDDDTATLTGSSSAPGQPSFTLDFDDIRVLPPGHHEDAITNLLEQHGSHVLVVGLIIIAFIAIVAWDRLVIRRRKA